MTHLINMFEFDDKVLVFWCELIYAGCAEMLSDIPGIEIPSV